MYPEGALDKELLQFGGLHEAVIDAVPGATAVIVAGLLPVVPVTTVALAVDDDAQLSVGLMDCPALSNTSAVSICVPPLLRVNEVLLEAASCTRIETAGQVR